MGYYEIPCKHETGEVSTDQAVSDYYPLATQEVIDLLDAAIGAKDHGDVSTVASIQCRLGQAILGQVCPRNDDGPVARKDMALTETFVNWIQNPFKEIPLTESSEIVVNIMELMR